MNFEIAQSVDFQPENEKKKIQREKIANSHRQMEGLIKELQKSSANKREKLPDGREDIYTPEGEKFQIYLLENPKDPAVKKLHSFMVKEFGEEEAEALYWLKISIAKKLNYYHILEKNGEIISFSNIQCLDLEDPACKENQPKELALVVWHISTNSKYRHKGLATELYQSFYATVLNKARSDQKTIKGVVGEAVSSVETFLNKMGRKRLYFEDKEGNVHEVPYMCPPVDVNDDGTPKEDPVPEHIMLRLIDGGGSATIEDLRQIVWAMYKEYVAEEEEYTSREAYETSLNYNLGLLKKLEVVLSGAKDGKIFMLSKKERERQIQELAQRGKKLFEVRSKAEQEEIGKE